LKFIHTADIHASKARKDATIRILSEIKETALNDREIRFVIIAGDFWDFTMTATEASGFSDILYAFKTMQDVVPVYMIYGTPSHEPSGSLTAFEMMKNVKVLEEGMHTECFGCTPVTFLAIPEPRLGKIEGSSLDEKYKTIQETFRNLIADAKKTAGPLIMIYHGDVEGAVLQNGQRVPGNGAAFPIKLLNELDPDYGAFGHIHMPQRIDGTNCYYPGSPCPKDFGEKHEGSFKIVEL
jgi:DNA repair exonuclease SbcCD nuclease subunit